MCVRRWIKLKRIIGSRIVGSRIDTGNDVTGYAFVSMWMELFYLGQCVNIPLPYLEVDLSLFGV